VESRTLKADRLLAANRNLGDVIFDPRLWPQILEQISEAAGGSGGAILQSDSRTPDASPSASVRECYNNYFATGWYRRDTLAERGFPLLMRGQKVISDQDIVTADEMRRLDFYNEIFVPFGFQWFAGIGFAAGPALWGMVIMRTPAQGPFEAQEKRVLASLSDRLSEIATLSWAVGRAALSGASNAMDLVGQPALVLDRRGSVLGMNAGAEKMFDAEFYIRNRCLTACDQHAASALGVLADQLRTTPDTVALPAAPIVVRRSANVPLLIRILPIDGAARSPFLGARALLTLSPIESKRAPDLNLLCEVFGLTRAEADVAALVSCGKPLSAIARRRGSSRVTVRNQMRTIFAKTGTHRQSELVALLASL
jgi:DNA-binding CsgD family transcriptional regulator